MHSVRVRALRWFECCRDIGESLTNLLMCGLECREVLAIGVVDLTRWRQHRPHERRVYQYRIEHEYLTEHQ